MSERRLLAALRRKELASFVAGAMAELAPGERYLDNFHIAAIAFAFLVALLRTRRVILQ